MAATKGNSFRGAEKARAIPTKMQLIHAAFEPNKLIGAEKNPNKTKVPCPAPANDTLSANTVNPQTAPQAKRRSVRGP